MSFVRRRSSTSGAEDLMPIGKVKSKFEDAKLGQAALQFRKSNSIAMCGGDLSTLLDVRFFPLLISLLMVSYSISIHFLHEKPMIVE